MKVKSAISVILLAAAVSSCSSKDEFKRLDLISTEEISQNNRAKIASVQSQPQSAPAQPAAVDAPSAVPVPTPAQT